MSARSLKFVILLNLLLIALTELLAKDNTWIVIPRDANSLTIQEIIKEEVRNYYNKVKYSTPSEIKNILKKWNHFKNQNDTEWKNTSEKLRKEYDEAYNAAFQRKQNEIENNDLIDRINTLKDKLKEHNREKEQNFEKLKKELGRISYRKVVLGIGKEQENLSPEQIADNIYTAMKVSAIRETNKINIHSLKVTEKFQLVLNEVQTSQEGSAEPIDQYSEQLSHIENFQVHYYKVGLVEVFPFSNKEKGVPNLNNSQSEEILVKILTKANFEQLLSENRLDRNNLQKFVKDSLNIASSDNGKSKMYIQQIMESHEARYIELSKKINQLESDINELQNQLQKADANFQKAQLL